jgi:hypothetical protein
VAELTSAEVFLAALRLLETALTASSRDDAALDCRSVASSYDVELARRVAGAVAVIATWQLPADLGGVDRLRLRRVLERLRLEGWAAL